MYRRRSCVLCVKVSHEGTDASQLLLISLALRDSFLIDTAQCQHYGVRTCEGSLMRLICCLTDLIVRVLLGCKGFFKVSDAARLQ